MTQHSHCRMPLRASIAVLMATFAITCAAQDASTPSPPTEKAAPPGMNSMSWLEGCWQGSVNKRDFREVWLPLRAGMMLGVSETVSGDKMLDFEYLRIESRGDSAYYVISPPGKAESAFKLTEELVDASDGAHTFVFLDPGASFPQRIGYRRANEGWLYIEVEGTVNAAPHKLIYPMRRIGCESGEVLAK